MPANTPSLKTKELPRIADWPVEIQQLPLMPETLPLDERVRRLCFEPDRFRQFLHERLDEVVGVRGEGARCPLSAWLRWELGLANEGSITVAGAAVGLHDCGGGWDCERHPHVQHRYWMHAFIRYIDRGSPVPDVLGREALLVLDAVLSGTPSAFRRLRSL
jgi:hypothetical protein